MSFLFLVLVFIHCAFLSLFLSLIVSSSDLPAHTITSLHVVKSHVSLEGCSAGIILPFCESVCVSAYVHMRVQNLSVDGGKGTSVYMGTYTCI